MIKLEPPAEKKGYMTKWGLAYPANNLELADKQMSLPIEKNANPTCQQNDIGFLIAGKVGL